MWIAGDFGLLEEIDRETGLYFEPIPPVGDYDYIIHDKRVQSHNETIKKYIKDNGIPKNSFKPWEKQLFNLRAFYEAQSQINQAIHLDLGGAEVVSPEGKYGLKLEMRTMKTQPATNQICLTSINSNKEEASMIVNQPQINLVWGPPGSWFMVFERRRLQNGATKDYVAYDLRNQRVIRYESFSLKPLASEQK